MRRLFIAMLLFSACQPVPSYEEEISAIVEQIQAVADEGKETILEYMLRQLPPHSGPGLAGSPFKGDVLLWTMQDLSREVDRALDFKKAKPAEWEAYKAQPHYKRVLSAVAGYVASEDLYVERLRVTNAPKKSIAESKRIFEQFHVFLSSDQ